MSRPLSFVRVFVICLVGSYAAAVLGLFVFQRDILFPVVPAEPLADFPGADRVQVAVEGGTIPMDLSGPATAPRVVFFHGNHEQIGFTRTDAALAEAGGLSFAAVEYPGYGDAHAGTPSEASILAAARAALATLATPGAGAGPICVGHSLGSGVAVAMAVEGLCSKLVAISPYTSIPDMAAERYTWLPVRWLVLDRFDSLSRAPDVEVPTLVIHGRRDGMIPFRMGETLAAAIPGARFVPRDRGHNDIRDRETWATIAEFVRTP